MPRILRWAVPLLAVFVVALGYAGPTTTSKEKRSMRETNLNPVDGATTMGAFGGSTATPLPAGWWNTTRPAAVGTYTGLSTFYDLQTNGGSPTFIAIDTTRPGHIHVVFTTCEDSASTSWPTRRVSYARSTDNGVTWGDQQESPLAVRAGFPALDLYRTGAGIGFPVVAGHFGDPVIADLTLIDISAAPTQIDLPDPDQPVIGNAIWPSVACAWDGSIIMHHSVNLTGNEAQNYINQLDPSLTTWSGTTAFPNVFGGAARSSTVAAADGRVGSMAKSDSTGDLWLYESTNNGSTWSSIVAYPSGRVHPSGDTCEVSVNWDMMYTPTDRYMAFSTADEAGTFAQSRIEFYSTATGFVDAVPRDNLLWKSSLAGARTQPTGLPSIGISGSKILIAFVGYLDATPVDPVSGGSEGDIFLVQSTDGGFTWSQPANLTESPTVDDKWVSISRWNENGYANLVWQEDPLAGNTIDGFGDARARQVFLKVDVSNLFPADDITTLSVTAPSNGFGVLQGTKARAAASFRNTGLAGQTSVPVRLEVLNSTPSVVFTSNKTIATFASAATVSVEFDSIPNSLALGFYTVRAEALLPGDLRPANDTAYSSINVFPIVTVSAPPSGSRESYHASWDVPSPEGLSGGWYTAAEGGSNDWVLGTPGKTQLSHAHSGPNSYVTKLTGNYTANSEAYLASPSFDMSALSGNITVEFFHNFQIEANWDHATFVYSIDGGLTWLVADSALGSGPNFNTAISTGWYNEDIDSNQFSTPYQYGPFSWSGGAGTVGQPGSEGYPGNNDGWIRSTTVLPLGGQSDVRFRFNWFSDASAVAEGWAVDDFSFGPTTGSSSVSILANWNMISNPVAAPNDSVKALYPNSTFAYAFSFGASGYTQDFTMDIGTGYWAKFPGSETAVVSGAPVFTYDVPVINGWNMIGSVGSPVDTAEIIDEPAGIQIGTYFAYAGGYSNAVTINPGQAVWAKMNAPGHLYYSQDDAPIPPSVSAKPTEVDAFAGLNKLVITDNAGNGTTLYFGSLDNISIFELPPVPPAGAFDARFVSGHMVQTTKKQNAGNVELPIDIQSIAYPVTVRWDIAAGAEYMLATGISSSIMRGTGSATIKNSSVNRVVVSGAGEEALPTSYSLFQNYPNPFNPSTNVKFALPLQSRVNVEIYNVLGQRVRTLVNDEFVAGYHVVEWNGKNDAGQQLSSGVYMLKIAATNTDGRSFSDVRKLMMVK